MFCYVCYIVREVEVEKKDVKLSEIKRNNFCLITHVSLVFIQSQKPNKLYKA
jgi:hypothetical protein